MTNNGILYSMNSIFYLISFFFVLYLKGPVRFYNNERKASFVLKQFQNGEWVKIGEYNSLYNHLDLSLGSPIKWVSLLIS